MITVRLMLVSKFITNYVWRLAKPSWVLRLRLCKTDWRFVVFPEDADTEDTAAEVAEVGTSPKEL